MTAKIPYKHGETVYLLNDDDQLAYKIVAFILHPNQLLQLRISDGGYYYDVYEFEVSTEKDILRGSTPRTDTDEDEK